MPETSRPGVPPLKGSDHGMDGLYIYMGYLIATCETKSLRAFQTVEDSIQTGHVYFSASKLTPH